MKHKLAGKVQLPLEQVVQMIASEQEFAQAYAAEYGLGGKLVLNMFAEEHYE